jgi:hypothetical protein
MPDARDSIIDGVELGLRRCREHLRDFTVTEEAATEARAKAVELVERFGLERWNPRALQVLGELITVAVGSRRQYRERPLMVEEMALFAWGLSHFLNSWIHE